MHAAGTTKTLAVSNFSPKQLDVVASVASSKATMPTVNQLVSTRMFESNVGPSARILMLSSRSIWVFCYVCMQPYGVGFNNYYGGRAAEIVAENRKRGVVVQAWSPLRKALKGRAREACAEIGQKYQKSAAQVALRWIADANGGATFTTQTQSKSHFEEDLNIFDFKLTDEEVATLAAL